MYFASREQFPENRIAAAICTSDKLSRHYHICSFAIVLAYPQGSQSVLTAPRVLLDQSWMNFSILNTPVRSSLARL